MNTAGVKIRPALYRKLKRFADQKNVNVNLLLNTVLQDFLDSWDKEFTAEDHHRWEEKCEKWWASEEAKPWREAATAAKA